MRQIDYTKNPMWLIRTGGGSSGGGGTTTQVEPYENSVRRTIDEKVGEHPSVLDWGADRTGANPSGAAFQSAIDAVSAAGGGTLFVPKGDYGIDQALDLKSDVELRGEGSESKLFRTVDLADGQGLINVDGDYVAITNLEIDGQTITPRRTLYGEFGGDPMHPILTKNTSVWVHSGSRFRMSGCHVIHTGGYSVLLDARVSGVSHVIIEHNYFEHNRPHLFGINSGDIEYGSWTGGILMEGNGTSRAVEDALFFNNTFRRVTGNCIWGHLYAFGKLHSNIRHIGNHFEDFGLDGILVGGVTGGIVEGNTFRRGGYIALDDTNLPTPRYMSGRHSVALDTSGLVKAVNYVGNTFTSCNGSCMDLDGYSNGVVSSNYAIMPEPGSPEYTEDQLDRIGPLNDGTNACYGLQIGSTSQTQEGGYCAEIVGNVFRNMAQGAIRLCCARQVHVVGNNIDHPDNAAGPPVWIFNGGTADQLRSTDIVVESNLFKWNPATAQKAAVFEHQALGYPWAPGDANYVRNNKCVGTCHEFKKDPTTSSSSDLVVSSQEDSLSERSEAKLRRQGGADGYTRILHRYAENADIINATLYDTGLLNVSVDGAAYTGAISTGQRTQVGMPDAVVTGKSIFDAFMAARSKESGTFRDADADALDADWALLRFNRTLGIWEHSINVTSNKRVWVPFSGGTTGGTPGGASTNVQFNSAGAFGGSANFIWNNTEQVVRINGKAATQTESFYGLILDNGSVNSKDGFYTPNTAYNAIQAPAGGVQAKFVSTLDAFVAVGQAAKDASKAPSAGQGAFYYNITAKQFEYWDEGAAQWLPFGKSSGGSISGLESPGVAYATSSTSVGTTSNFVWYNTDQHLVVTGKTGTAAISAATGYIEAEGGFATTNKTITAVNALSGGVSGKWLYAGDSIFAAGLLDAPAAPDAGQGKFYYNKRVSRWEVYDPGVPGWVPIQGISGTLIGTGVAFAQDADRLETTSKFVYDKGSGRLYVEGASNTAEALYVATGITFSHGGFSTDNDTAYAINVASGGVTAKLVGIGESLTIAGKAAAPSSPGVGQGRIYYSTANNGQFMFWDHAAGNWKPFGQAATGGIPGGFDTYVQVNKNGVFEGYSAFTYVDSSKTVTTTNLYLKGTENRTFNCEGTGIIDAFEMRTDSVDPGTITAGKYGGREIRFRLDSTVPTEVSSGSIVYKSGYCPDGLGIVGGTLAPERKISMWDWVYFPAVPASGYNIETSGAIKAATGYYTPSGNYQAIQAPSGGVYARSGHFLYYTDIGSNAGVPGETTNATHRDGTIYYDTTLNQLQLRRSSVWVTLSTGTGATPGGPNGAVQVNANGSFGGYGYMMYNPYNYEFAVADADGALAQFMSAGYGSTFNIFTPPAANRRSLSIHHQNTNQSPFSIYNLYTPPGGSPGWVLTLHLTTEAEGWGTYCRFLRTVADPGPAVGEGRYGANFIRLAQVAGDDANASTIANRASWYPSSLSIVGAGGIVNGAFDRKITMYDWVYLPGHIGGQSLRMVGSAQADGGFWANNVSWQSIQSPSGGVYAKSGFFLNYTDIGNSYGVPPPMTSGQESVGLRWGCLYFDTSVNQLKTNTPSGWQAIALGTGGSASSGPGGAVQRSNGAGGFIGDSNLMVVSTGQLLIGPQGAEGGELVLQAGTSQSNAVVLDCVGSGDGYFRMYGTTPPYYVRLNITGQPNTWSLKIDNGYVDSAGGFTTGHNEWNVIKAELGGIYARSLICVSYVGLGVNYFNPANSSGAPVQTGSHGIQFGSIFYSNYDHEIYFLKGPTGAGLWTRLSSQGGSAGGSTFTTPISTTAGGAAIYCNNGYMQAGFGFNALNSNYDSIQTVGGIKAGIGYWVGNTAIIDGNGTYLRRVEVTGDYVGAQIFQIWYRGVGAPSGGGWVYGLGYPNYVDIPPNRTIRVVGGIIQTYF
jgi:hypothetical protein